MPSRVALHSLDFCCFHGGLADTVFPPLPAPTGDCCSHLPCPVWLTPPGSHFHLTSGLCKHSCSCNVALCILGSPLFHRSYVCETMANRVLRFVQKPTGVYHFSVFYQVWPRCPLASFSLATKFGVSRSAGPHQLVGTHFSAAQFAGGLGPTGIACDSAGNIYVARFDFAPRGDTAGAPSSSSPGLVSVLSSSGSLLKEVECPASEVTGIVVSGCVLRVAPLLGLCSAAEDPCRHASDQLFTCQKRRRTLCVSFHPNPEWACPQQIAGNLFFPNIIVMMADTLSTDS